MMDFARKTFYVGLGLATLTKEKLETFAKEMADYTKMSEDEGRKFAEYLQVESRKARESLKENVEQLVQNALGRLPYARKIEMLEQRVAALELAVGIQAATQATPEPPPATDTAPEPECPPPAAP